MLFKDQLHRNLYLKEAPKRIISLVPSQTELLVDLNLRHKVVGVTKFCVHPKDLRLQTAVVGGTKQVKIKKIKALNPDIILCNKEENTKEMIEELEQIAPVHISNIYTLKDSLELINMYGEIFDKTEKSQSLIDRIQSRQNAFNEFVKNQPKLSVAYFIWKAPYMVAAQQTFIDDMLKINNFENVFQNLIRYPEINIIELKDLKPDVILLSSEPFPFKTKDIGIFQSASPESKVIIVDGEAFSWYGSRLIKAFNYFKDLRARV